jgi:hypothetical protein
MKETTAPEADDDQRRCERLSLHQQIYLELDSGTGFRGNTENISLSGMLLRTDTSPDTGIVGRAGVVHLVHNGQSRSDGYPCRVIRVVNGCIALELERRAAAAFGMRLTRDLRGRGVTDLPDGHR